MAEPQPSISFPARCAACQAPAAFPFVASTIKDAADSLRIGLRCRACHHEWFLQFRTTRQGLYEISDDPSGPD